MSLCPESSGGGFIQCSLCMTQVVCTCACAICVENTHCPQALSVPGNLCK